VNEGIEIIDNALIEAIKCRPLPTPRWRPYLVGLAGALSALPKPA
jgi:hypothetical protein